MKLRFCVLFIFTTISLLGITPEEIKEAYSKSYNYEKIEDYENAIRALSTVVDEYPNGYTVNLRLGWLYYLLGKYANSIHHYELAIKSSSYSLEAKLGYMLPLLAQNKYGEVESMAYKITSTDYYNYYANLRLAYSLRMQEKFDQAEKICNTMLSAYPTDIAFLIELAYIKVGQENTEKAGLIFWDVLVLDPENEYAKSYLMIDNGN